MQTVAGDVSETGEAGSPTLNGLWWLDPLCVFVLAGIATFLVALATPESVFLAFGARKHLDASHLAIAGMALASFFVGCRLGAAGNALAPAPSAGDRRRRDLWLRTWFYAATALSVLGYAVWLASGVRNGLSLDVVRQFLFGGDPGVADAIQQEYLKTLPGMTTMTQFSIGAMVLGVYLAVRRVPRIVPALVLLMAMAAGRAILRSERLALLELALPAAVLALRIWFLGRQVSPRTVWILRALPVAGLVAIVLLFATAEYFRSWQYCKETEDSFAGYIGWRLAAYYTTAHNNGAIAVERIGRLPLPYTVLEDWWRFPPVKASPISYQQLTGIDPEVLYQEVLERYSTPEFNNSGGLLFPIVDLGWFLFPLFWVAHGWVVGRTYRGFLLGTLPGLLGYPIVFLALLEVPRLLYLVTTRLFPTLVLFAAMAIFFPRRPEKTS